MVVAFPAVGTLFPAQTGDALKVPGAFKHWRLVHSTLIAKDDNKLDLIAGGHHRPASICVGEANDAESEFSASNIPTIEAAALTSRERRVIFFTLPPARVRSTVDVEYLSADLACVREVQDGVGDIIHVRKLSHRLQRPEKIFWIVLVHRRVHDSGGYRVESDPVLGILDGQALDRRVQPALGDHWNRRVHSCDRLIGERGGDAHNGAGPLFEHLRHGKLGDVEKAQEIGRHQGVKVFGCELSKRSVENIPAFVTRRSMLPNFSMAAATTLAAVSFFPMSPSTRTRFGEAAKD